jgi:hypothetical protein
MAERRFPPPWSGLGVSILAAATCDAECDMMEGQGLMLAFGSVRLCGQSFH